MYQLFLIVLLIILSVFLFSLLKSIFKDNKSYPENNYINKTKNNNIDSLDKQISDDFKNIGISSREELNQIWD